MPWDLSHPYYFAFGPDEDDSEVRIVNLNHDAPQSTWQHTTKGLLPGKKRAIEWRAPKNEPGNAWLFSRSFTMKAGKSYEAAIMYKLALEHGERIAEPTAHGVTTHQLTLHLGTSQKPEAMKQPLVNWGVANTHPQTVRVTFHPPADGTYYFGIRAHSPAGTPGGVVLLINSGVESGRDTNPI